VTVQQHPCALARSAGECRDNARLAAAQERALREVFRMDEEAGKAADRARYWRRQARAARPYRSRPCRRT
jgi:hypothetical protein